MVDLNTDLDKILSEYSLGNVIEIIEPDNGSGEVYIIKTINKSYVLKNSQRSDFVEVYKTIYDVLTGENIRINKIVRTKNSELISSQNSIVLDYIEGDVKKEFDYSHLRKAIKYLVDFNNVISVVKIDEIRLDSINVWDYAKSMQYVSRVLSDTFKSDDLLKIFNDRVSNIVNFINEYLLDFQIGDNQLIHSDLGADNFVLRNDEFIGVIDFTPDIDSKHYSFAHFMYWNCLWNNSDIVYSDINMIFDIYKDYCIEKYSDKDLLLYLIKASIYRFAAPTLSLIEKNQFSIEKVEQRLIIAERLIGFYSYLLD